MKLEARNGRLQIRLGRAEKRAAFEEQVRFLVRIEQLLIECGSHDGDHEPPPIVLTRLTWA
jgi:hypothetical protein